MNLEPSTSTINALKNAFGLDQKVDPEHNTKTTANQKESAVCTCHSKEELLLAEARKLGRLDSTCIPKSPLEIQPQFCSLYANKHKHNLGCI